MTKIHESLVIPTIKIACFYKKTIFPVQRQFCVIIIHSNNHSNNEEIEFLISSI